MSDKSYYAKLDALALVAKNDPDEFTKLVNNAATPGEIAFLLSAVREMPVESAMSILRVTARHPAIVVREASLCALGRYYYASDEAKDLLQVMADSDPNNIIRRLAEELYYD